MQVRKLLEDFRQNGILYMCINILILVDFALIAYLLIFNPPSDLTNIIIIFDVALCAILLLDLFYKFQKSDERGEFIRHNVVFIIASIPFELVLPAYFMAFRFLLFFKLFKLSGVLERYFKSIHRFVESTRFDKIVTWIAFTVILFTFAIYLIDPSLDLFDSLWYVVVTLTTVGYGDVTPTTFSAKVISIMLLFMGIFVFSIFTGAVSSYFTDKILDIDSDTEEGIAVLDEKVEDISSQLDDIKHELELSRAENRKLQEKLDEALKK